MGRELPLDPIKLLLDAGADTKRAYPNSSFSQPQELPRWPNTISNAEWVVKWKRPSVLKILLEADADSETLLLLRLAAVTGDTEVVKVLLDTGANLNEPLPEGPT